MKHSEQQVVFQNTDDPRFPYEAVIGAERWAVRINEFPESDSLYTLMVDGVAVEELMEWPRSWKRPEPTTTPQEINEDDPVEKYEYEKELEKFERTRNIPPHKP